MVFPMKPAAKKPLSAMIDDPSDDVGQPAHAEPEGDEQPVDEMDSLMGQDIGGKKPGEEIVGGQSPLEDALVGAGFQVSPDKLAKIQAILEEGEAEGEEGGMVPSELNVSDLAGR